MVHLFIFLNEENLIGVLVNLKKKQTPERYWTSSKSSKISNLLKCEIFCYLKVLSN